MKIFNRAVRYTPFSFCTGVYIYAYNDIHLLLHLALYTTIVPFIHWTVVPVKVTDTISIDVFPLFPKWRELLRVPTLLTDGVKSMENYPVLLKWLKDKVRTDVNRKVVQTVKVVGTVNGEELTLVEKYSRQSRLLTQLMATC